MADLLYVWSKAAVKGEKEMTLEGDYTGQQAIKG